MRHDYSNVRKKCFFVVKSLRLGFNLEIKANRYRRRVKCVTKRENRTVRTQSNKTPRSGDISPMTVDYRFNQRKHVFRDIFDRELISQSCKVEKLRIVIHIKDVKVTEKVIFELNYYIVHRAYTMLDSQSDL